MSNKPYNDRHARAMQAAAISAIARAERAQLKIDSLKYIADIESLDMTFELAKRLAKGLFPTGLSHRFISEHFSTTGRSPASRTPDLSRVGELVMKYKDMSFLFIPGATSTQAPPDQILINPVA